MPRAVEERGLSDKSIPLYNMAEEIINFVMGEAIMKILLIDDSSLARRILKRVLEKENHEIIEAGSGIEGLEKFYLEKPDVVFWILLWRD